MRMYLVAIVFMLSMLIFTCRTNNEIKEGDGSRLFKTYCVNCHGIDGSLMTNGARNLRFSNLSLAERILVVSQGRNAMTPFQNTLNSDQIQSVAKYTFQLADSAIHAK